MISGSDSGRRDERAKTVRDSTVQGEWRRIVVRLIARWLVHTFSGSGFNSGSSGSGSNGVNSNGVFAQSSTGGVRVELKLDGPERNQCVCVFITVVTVVFRSLAKFHARGVSQAPGTTTAPGDTSSGSQQIIARGADW